MKEPSAIKTHADKTLPLKFEVFVFGSNRAGRHGAGAALVAVRKYGAEYGMAEGKYGKSYAIPTKDCDLRTLSLPTIKRHVDRFCTFAKAYKGTKFFVTRVGCGLAGFKDSDIAPMFAPAMPNCDYPEEWLPYLQE